jgi:uncharacterized protein
VWKEASVPTQPIIHVEIPARDLETASQFYAQVFDWKLDLSVPEYPQFQAAGGPCGGFVAVREEASEHGLKYTAGEVLIYLGTDDIDAALARVEAHGGKTLVPRTEIPSIGHWAMFEDPTGNRIGLYSSLRPHAS